MTNSMVADCQLGTQFCIGDRVGTPEEMAFEQSLERSAGSNQAGKSVVR